MELLGAALVLALAGDGDFPVFVWRQDHRGRPLPQALVAPFGGTNVERDESAEWVRERGLDFYVGHAPGRDELHLRRTPTYREWFDRWYESRDPALLVRRPCLTAPETRARLFAQLERSARARNGEHGFGLSLGDEVSLTPWGDPLDLCRSATCEARWRTWCEGRGLDPERSPTTDEVRLALADGETELLDGWLARRRFHQDVVLELLDELAGRARTLAPGTPIGLLGAGGQTAFGGVAIERALHFLDFVEAYPVDLTRELLATRAEPHHRSVATLFPEDDASGGGVGSPLRLWEHVARGGDAVVLWSDRELAQRPSWRRRLARAVADVRRVLSAIPPSARSALGTPGRVALVHSPDSLAARWLHDALLDGPTWPNLLAGYQREHGTRDRAIASWLRLAEDAGHLPGVVMADELSAATRERFELLVLPHVEVLSEDELDALLEFLAAGGRVVVQGRLGRYDALGSERESDLEPALRDRFGDRVLEAPDRIDDYLAVRRSPRDGVARELRGWLDSLLPSSPFDAAVELTGGSLPFLRQARAVEGGALLCIAIPNATTAEERSALRPRTIELDVSASRTVEWLHPPTAQGTSVELDAGDGLVFVLRIAEAADPR